MVCGPMDVAAPGFSKVVNVRSAIEMHEAVLSRAKDYDVLVHCAAVADYRPAEVANEKIKDSRSQLHLDLIPNTNILRYSVAQNINFSFSNNSPLNSINVLYIVYYILTAFSPKPNDFFCIFFQI